MNALDETAPTCRTCTHSVAMDDQSRPGVVQWCALRDPEGRIYDFSFGRQA